MRGTAEGKAADSSYNATVVLNNIRYAMIDQIKAPRPGFEEVTHTHFRLLRRRIMAQCQRWKQDAAGMDQLHRASLQKSIAELQRLLTQL